MLSERVSSLRSEKVSLPLNHFPNQPIHTERVSTLRPLINRFAPDVSEKSVEALQTEISVLCSERQHLRAAGAGEAELERNRLEIARLQWELSHALIGRYARHAAA
jgi:hypothetical protein